MSKKKYYYNVKVLTPWHTTCEYTFSRDLQKAIKMEFKSNGANSNYKSILIHSLINVPIFGKYVNIRICGKNYLIAKPIIIPCRIIAIFIKHRHLKKYTQGQFISSSNYDPQDLSQRKYFQHDYNLLNKFLINRTLNYWNKFLKNKER